jgi:hypothetical protein
MVGCLRVSVVDAFEDLVDARVDAENVGRTSFDLFLKGSYAGCGFHAVAVLEKVWILLLVAEEEGVAVTGGDVVFS